MAGPTYVYTPNVPLGATPFNQTQAPILSNFRAINELIGVNHVSFNNNDFGKHNFCVLPSRTELPPVTSTDGALYCSTTTDSYGYGLYYEYPDGTTSQQITDQSSNLSPSSNISQTIVMSSGFVICRGQIPTGNIANIAYLSSIGGSVNPPFIYSPYVSVSEISGAYYSYTKRGTYNNNQTNFSGNIAGNYMYAFVAFGF